MDGADLACWDRDRARICERIRGTAAPLKIVLKTKNEREFLRPWIALHARIAGPGNLLVFDNGSTDPEVLAVLRDFAETGVVARFGGFHNDLHRPAAYPELYEALRQSCDYFAILDTDEFLAWMDDDGARHLPPEAILGRLRALPPQEVVLGLWLDNYRGYDDRFILFRGDIPVPAGLTTGKSLIASAAPLPRVVCHNFQLDTLALTAAKAGNLLVRHMKRLLPAQRVRANLEKLRQYRFLAAGEGLDRVLATALEDLPPGNVRLWVREIQALSSGTAPPPDQAARLLKGHLRLDPGGEAQFGTERERRNLRRYLDDPGAVMAEALEQRQARQAQPIPA